MDKLIKASLIASVVTIGGNMEKKESEKENSPKEEQNILEEQIIKEIEEHDAELEKGLLEKKESGEIEPKEKGTNEVSYSKTVLACCNNCLRRFDPQENAREVTKEA